MVVEPPLPQPLIAAPSIASNNTSSAKAGLATQARVSVCLQRRSHSNTSSTGRTQRIGKRFQGILFGEESAGGISIALAVVLTLIVTGVGPAAVTGAVEPEPVHVALAGAPVQLIVTMTWSGAAPPTSESWREYMAVCPAFTVAEVEPPAAAPIVKSSVAFMVSVSAADVLAAKLGSPPYTVVIKWLPTDIDEVTNAACPFAFSVPVPICVLPSKNCTVPVGVPVVELRAAAVKVTDRPDAAGFRDDATATELPA